MKFDCDHRIHCSDNTTKLNNTEVDDVLPHFSNSHCFQVGYLLLLLIISQSFFRIHFYNLFIVGQKHLISFSECKQIIYIQIFLSNILFFPEKFLVGVINKFGRSASFFIQAGSFIYVFFA